MINGRTDRRIAVPRITISLFALLLGLAACADTASFGLPPVRCDEPPPATPFVGLRERDPLSDEGDRRLCVDIDGGAVIEQGGESVVVALTADQLSALGVAVDEAREVTFGIFESEEPSAKNWRITASSRTAEIDSSTGPEPLQVLIEHVVDLLEELSAA